MADWLVTFTNSLEKSKRDEIIRSAGAALHEGADPVALGSEIAVTVSADSEAAAALRKAKDVIEVYPSSEMTLY